ncbi:nmrA-like family domain-containing protein 1 [Babylonia areolata]|uniref:nmrA-like family domain-containing protein 1 n=1 Tax=Babylonia areolata TaxID=304850 RepID=UPI003FD00FB0
MQSLTPPVDMPENRRGSSSQSESPSVKSKKAFGRILPRNTNDPEPPPVVTEKRLVLVMGATGLVGGSVARGLLSYPWYCVLVATRRPWCAEAVLLKQAGAKLVEVDFNYKHSLVLAMQGVSCVFLHTSFWENYSCTMEVIHGQNAVDAAVEAEVEHLIYNGTNYVKPEDGRVCSFLKSKLEIEDYIRDSGLMYTIVVLPFYFENFLSVFRPFEITPDLFVMSVSYNPDRCGVKGCGITTSPRVKLLLPPLLQGTLYMEHKVTLSAEMLSVQQMITHFSKSLDGLSFIDPELTVEDFQDFGFPGSKDMAAMFLFYQMCEDIPDFSVTRALNPHTRSMQQWIEDNHAHIVEVLEEALCTVKSCHVKFHKPPHLRN